MSWDERTAAADEAVWGTPRESVKTRQLPTFPTHLLPPVLGRMVQGAADEIQAPVDIAGMLALSVAASTLAGKVQFVGRPGHYEHAMLWTLSLSSSAERKTPVFSLLRKPLAAVEREFAETARMAADRDAIELDLIEAEITKARKEAGGAGNINSVMAQIDGLLQRRNALTGDKLMPCAWVSSPTPESVHSEMAKTGGRLAIFADEGGVIGVLAGRYSQKGGADLDPFLHGYVGSPLRAPRAGKDRKDVAGAYLTIGLAVQPTILQEIGEVTGAEEKGLLGRFLFAMPASRVGQRMYEDSVAITDEVLEEYEYATYTWGSWLGNEDGTTVRITLDDAAYGAYAKFYNSIELRLRDGGDLAEVPSWGGKIAGTALRIAGLMHCYAAPTRKVALSTPIGEDTIACAVELVEDYLIPHAKAAFDTMRESAEARVARRILDWITTRDVDHFTLRELFQALKSGRGSVKRVDDLTGALDALITDGYIRVGNSERRNAVVYEINPLWDRNR